MQNVRSVTGSCSPRPAGRVRAFVGTCVLALATVVVSACASGSAGTQEPGTAQVVASPAERVVREARDARLQAGRLRGDAPAVAFPEGTSYGEALRAIFMMEAGAPSPLAATVVAPLPAGIVLSLPRAGDRGATVVSLAAPYGYDVGSGRPLVNPLAVRDPAQVGGRSSRGAWPSGVGVPVPILPKCMVAPGASCEVADVVRISETESPSIPLP